MKKFWVCLVLAICCGTACAWAVNYNRYGHRTAHFGPFNLDGDVTPDNVIEFLESKVPKTLGRVELPNGSAHDFGVMSPNQEGSHAFIVKNVGEGDLKLKIGASSCKCTVGSLDKESIKPGEETEVLLEWSVKTDDVVFSQSAQLITDDPGKVVINLSVAGRVIGELEMVPESWSFGEVAAGEPIELSGTVYSFYDHDIIPTKMMFSDDEMNDLAEFKVDPFQPTEESDGLYARARQGFRVHINIKPGMRQGAVSQNFMFGFQKMDDNGEIIPPPEGDVDPNDYAITSTRGRIVGSLGMIEGPRIDGQQGGGYIYDFGRIGADDPLSGKSFIVLKGSDRENTELRIGSVSPEQYLKATLGKPIGKGSMTLYPLQIEVIPGDERVARLGKDRNDYGNIWIESNNPKVTKMRVAVKFAVEPR